MAVQEEENKKRKANEITISKEDHEKKEQEEINLKKNMSAMGE
jgi:hypothetical protein